jgi:hypothetical protein
MAAPRTAADSAQFVKLYENQFTSDTLAAVTTTVVSSAATYFAYDAGKRTAEAGWTGVRAWGGFVFHPLGDPCYEFF